MFLQKSNDIPKMFEKLASRRVQSAANRFLRRGLYYSILAPFARIDLRQLSIPFGGQLLKHFGYKTAEHIRDRWLVFAGICSMYSMVTDSLFTLFVPGENSSLVFIISSSVVTFVLLYYFSYKKPGTRLLTFMMLMKVLSLVGMIGLTQIFILPGSSILNYCLSAIDFFLIMGWLFLSSQLRKINLSDQLLCKTL